jgi:tRNA-specific 2-thiouridylase
MQKPLPNPQSKDRVIVGMSGGVDSAVAALLLRDAGYSVQALFMSNWEDDDAYCTTAADFQDARRVSDILAVPLHRVSFAGEYRDRVFSQFLREYSAGRTPNPDVLCNREIKFGICLEYMQRLGADWIATGHYAQIRRSGSHPELLKAADAAKDQSYFLHAVPAEALSKTLFPLGGMHKPKVREIAHAAGLPVFDKRDSTGICFIGERPFQDFLSQHLHTAPGPPKAGSSASIAGSRCILWASVRASRSGAGPGQQPRPGMWRTRLSRATRSSWSRINTIRCSCRTSSASSRCTGSIQPMHRRTRSNAGSKPVIGRAIWAVRCARAAPRTGG